jgi:hypothetical protein
LVHRKARNVRDLACAFCEFEHPAEHGWIAIDYWASNSVFRPLRGVSRSKSVVMLATFIPPK